MRGPPSNTITRNEDWLHATVVLGLWDLVMHTAALLHAHDWQVCRSKERVGAATNRATTDGRGRLDRIRIAVVHLLVHLVEAIIGGGCGAASTCGHARDSACSLVTVIHAGGVVMVVNHRIAAALEGFLVMLDGLMAGLVIDACLALMLCLMILTL